MKHIKNIKVLNIQSYKMYFTSLGMQFIETFYQ